MLGDFGEVLVMDWGLARISSEFPNADAVTQSDVMGGTPAYMAPEMATGPIEEVTVMSDVYLLGAILYEILTGRPPHTGKTVMACLFSAAKNKIVATDHAGELMEVALEAMATNPADRYPSVPLMQEAIRRYQSHSESVLLTDSAEKSLAAAQEADDYELFSRALYGFQEALTLWKGNDRASKSLSAAQVAYAGSALAKSDFDLGISLLDSNNDEHRRVLEKLESGRRERDSRNRRLKMLKGAVAALVFAVVGVVGVAYFAVSTERDKAVVARDEAVQSEARAVKSRQEEEIAKNDAIDARDQEKVAREAAELAAEKEAIARKEEELAKIAAEEARDKEEQAKHEEELAKIAAEKARDRAIEAEKIAEQAKKDEEYEAYVARIGLANAKIAENAFDRARELLEECATELRDWEWGRLAYLCQLSDRTWNLAGPVESVVFSPDGRLFASGDFEGQVRIWDFETGETIHSIAQGQYVHTVAFDSAGQRLAAASSDKNGSNH
ncbi:MAG: protein kinase, partial [Planctomycetes bacterium]|nr:protein kinase [Planctomycetota bacterium]